MKTFIKKTTLAISAIATGTILAVVAQPAFAQSYPDRPIKMVVPYPPGGVSDTASRLIARALESKLNTTVVVENKSGAASSVASTYVANQKPDGYTIYAAPVSLVINPTLQGNVGYKPFEDFTPISMMMTSAFVLQTNPSIKADSVDALMGLIKANPGKYAIGTSGMGSINHLTAEYFTRQYGLDMLVVHYKGGMPAAQDLLGGQIGMMFSAVREALPLIESKKTNGLAITSMDRYDILPSIPTMDQATGSKDFEAIFWLALMAPGGLDKAIQTKLSAVMVEIGKDPQLRKEMEALGINLVTSTPEVVTANLKKDQEKWTSLMKEIKLK